VNPEDDKQGALARMFGGWNRLRSNPLADIALGFTPAGVVADVQDMARAVRDRSPTGIALAGAGFLPFGDIAKPILRNLPGRSVERAAEEAVAAGVVPMIESKGLSGVANLLSGRGPMGEAFLKRYRDLVSSGDRESAERLLDAANWSMNPDIAARQAREANRVMADVSLSGKEIPILGVPEMAGIDPDLAERYANRASRSGLSMAPEDVRARAEELFPVRLLHGAMAINAQDLSRRGLRPDKDFFTAVDNPVGAEIAASYGGAKGGVIPLRADPGDVFDLDAQGRAWANITPTSLVDAMYRSGMQQEDIVDFLKRNQSLNMSFDLQDAPEDLDRFLYELTDPYSEPSRELLEDIEKFSDYSTTDVAQMASDLGYDSTKIRNIKDRSWSFPGPEAMEEYADIPGDIMILRGENPRVRHEGAVFDPERINDRDIFAGLAGLFGVGTAARMMNQNREER